MMKFTKFLKEEASTDDKLKHLEHVEDHVIHGGSDGFAHAFHTLNGVHDILRGANSDTKITMKYDGSPSVVFGTHPETGKFFVSLVENQQFRDVIGQLYDFVADTKADCDMAYDWVCDQCDILTFVADTYAWNMFYDVYDQAAELDA